MIDLLLLSVLPVQTAQDVPPPPAPPNYAVRVKPIGDPASWLSREDFAKEKIEVFAVHYRVEVDTNGRVTGCMLTTAVVGQPRLEKVACSILKRRARFSPQFDRENKPMPSQWFGRWRPAAPTG